MLPSDELIHLFSYETGVSFELPLDWEELLEAPGVAEYCIDDDDEADDDGAGGPAALRFSVLAAGEGWAADAYRRLSEELLAASGRTLVEQADAVVDDAAVRITVTRGPAGPAASAAALDVTVVQAVAQRGERLWVLRGTAPTDAAHRYRAVFEAAIASARFIELDGGRR